MSSLNKRSISYPEASLTLALSAAEGRLLMSLGRPGPGNSVSEACGRDDNYELLFAQEWQATAQGVELLAPALDSALRALKLTPKHIGRIAAVSGPGSFTGLRLSIISAAGLARGIGAEQAGLPYLPLLASYAYAAWREFGPLAGSAADASTDCAAGATTSSAAGASGQNSEAPEFWAVTHARRDLVHMQGFASGAEGLVPLSDILVLGLEDAAARLSGGRRIAFGSGIRRNREFFAAALPTDWSGGEVRLLGPAFDQPSPSFLLQAALLAEYGQADIAPLYVRQSDAEENLEQISSRLGRNVGEAKELLQNILSSPPKNHG